MMRAFYLELSNENKPDFFSTDRGHRTGSTCAQTTDKSFEIEQMFESIKSFQDALSFEYWTRHASKNVKRVREVRDMAQWSKKFVSENLGVN